MAASRIQAAWTEARTAWPEVHVQLAELEAFVRARADGDSLPEHLVDLYLACAVARGDAAALRVFDRDILHAVMPAIRPIVRTASGLDEARQAVRVRLLVGVAGEPPRIAAYRGRGALHSWVRVVAVRTALNLVRGQRPAVAIDDLLGQLAAAEPDPQTRHLKDTYRADYANALREALAELSGRERALLRLHYVDGMRLAQIGALYRVHESTASRWVRAALDGVAAGARQRLVDRLALSGSAVDSVARMVRSGLDLSIRALLDEPSAPA